MFSFVATFVVATFVASVTARPDGVPFCHANEENFDEAKTAMNRPWGGYVNVFANPVVVTDQHNQVYDPSDTFWGSFKKGSSLNVTVNAWSDSINGYVISISKGIEAPWGFDIGEPLFGFDENSVDLGKNPNSCETVNGWAGAITHPYKLESEEISAIFHLPEDYEGPIVLSVIALTGRRPEDQLFVMQSGFYNVTDTPTVFAPAPMTEPAVTAAPISGGAPSDPPADLPTWAQTTRQWWPAFGATTVPAFGATATTAAANLPDGTTTASLPTLPPISVFGSINWYDDSILETFEDGPGDRFSEVYDVTGSCNAIDTRLALHTFVNSPNNNWKRKLTLMLGLEIGVVRDVEYYQQFQHGDTLMAFSIDDPSLRCEVLDRFNQLTPIQLDRMFLSPNAVIVARDPNHEFRQGNDNTDNAMTTMLSSMILLIVFICKY